MKRIKKLLLVLLIVSAGIGMTFAFPFTEELNGPKIAKLASSPPGTHFGVNVTWYDVGLNKERFHQKIDFDETGNVTLPRYHIPTSLGRVGLKRLLSIFNDWTACEHCFGPTAECRLYQVGQYEPPTNMRLAESQTRAEEVSSFAVILIPDESKFEERPFSPSNPADLLQEARALLAEGKTPYVPPARFGPELQALNPVRAEIFSGALILWMGGNLGYAVVPDGQGCPAPNRVMVSPTDLKGIYRLEKTMPPKKSSVTSK
jgi:hypothetical protein